MSWSAFWHWVDRDCNNMRPFSLVLFSAFAALPLFIAFAIGASESVIESARLVTLGALLLIVFPYYAWRLLRNVVRSFGDTSSFFKNLKNKDQSNG